MEIMKREIASFERIVIEYIRLTIDKLFLFFAILEDDNKLKPKSINKTRYWIMATEKPNLPYS